MHYRSIDVIRKSVRDTHPIGRHAARVAISRRSARARFAGRWWGNYTVITLRRADRVPASHAAPIGFRRGSLPQRSHGGIRPDDRCISCQRGSGRSDVQSAWFGHLCPGHKARSQRFGSAALARWPTRRIRHCGSRCSACERMSRHLCCRRGDCDSQRCTVRTDVRAGTAGAAYPRAARWRSLERPVLAQPSAPQCCPGQQSAAAPLASDEISSRGLVISGAVSRVPGTPKAAVPAMADCIRDSAMPTGRRCARAESPWLRQPPALGHHRGE